MLCEEDDGRNTLATLNEGRTILNEGRTILNEGQISLCHKSHQERPYHTE